MSTIDPRRTAEPGFFFKRKESNSSDPGIFDSKDGRMAKKAFFRDIIESCRSVRSTGVDVGAKIRANIPKATSFRILGLICTK
jgi:hypothetical protein